MSQQLSVSDLLFIHLQLNNHYRRSKIDETLKIVAEKHSLCAHTLVGITNETTANSSPVIFLFIENSINLIAKYMTV